MLLVCSLWNLINNYWTLINTNSDDELYLTLLNDVPSISCDGVNNTYNHWKSDMHKTAATLVRSCCMEVIKGMYADIPIDIHKMFKMLNLVGCLTDFLE